MYRKLGQDEEADSKLGELLSGIGSLLASEAAVGQVTPACLSLRSHCTPDSLPRSRHDQNRQCTCLCTSVPVTVTCPQWRCNLEVLKVTAVDPCNAIDLAFR